MVWKGFEFSGVGFWNFGFASDKQSQPFGVYIWTVWPPLFFYINDTIILCFYSTQLLFFSSSLLLSNSPFPIPTYRKFSVYRDLLRFWSSGYYTNFHYRTISRKLKWFWTSCPWKSFRVFALILLWDLIVFLRKGGWGEVSIISRSLVFSENDSSAQMVHFVEVLFSSWEKI